MLDKETTPGKDLLLSSYRYHLPPEQIAQYPAEKRDESRLFVLSADTRAVRHRQFGDIDQFLAPGDLLVVNNTRVIPARLHGKKDTGGKVEVFLLGLPAVVPDRDGIGAAKALIKASKRPRPGSVIELSPQLTCSVIERFDDMTYEVQLHFPPEKGLIATLEESGQVPLPPYINREHGSTREDQSRYQTIYAARPGAVAAPTAGLHFTQELLQRIQSKGVCVSEVTLHVGYGTFAPVRTEDITQHRIHHEYITIPEETVAAVQKTKAQGGKIWAVGTTTVRSLEYAAQRTGKLEAMSGLCDLYIYPGYRFLVIDNLITNFHLPDSSLLFLVAALCGRQTLLDCYATAIKKGYRFFSYGDAMAIISG